jgi:hypothetical protein
MTWTGITLPVAAIGVAVPCPFSGQIDRKNSALRIVDAETSRFGVLAFVLA